MKDLFSHSHCTHNTLRFYVQLFQFVFFCPEITLILPKTGWIPKSLTEKFQIICWKSSKNSHLKILNLLRKAFCCIFRRPKYLQEKLIGCICQKTLSTKTLMDCFYKCWDLLGKSGFYFRDVAVEVEDFGAGVAAEQLAAVPADGAPVLVHDVAPVLFWAILNIFWEIIVEHRR